LQIVIPKFLHVANIDAILNSFVPDKMYIDMLYVHIIQLYITL